MPNALCALLAVASLVSLGLLKGWDAVPWGLLHAVIALAVGMGLFALGWIGGGDAKFYAAAACAMQLVDGFSLLAWTSIAGIGLLLVTALLRFVRGHPVLRKGSWSVPYGVAIGLGLAGSLLSLHWQAI